MMGKVTQETQYATEASPDDILSDTVYHYNKDSDLFESLDDYYVRIQEGNVVAWL